MHMEAVQRYVISMEESEARELYRQISIFPSGKVTGALEDLYHTLENWLD